MTGHYADYRSGVSQGDWWVRTAMENMEAIIPINVHVMDALATAAAGAGIDNCGKNESARQGFIAGAIKRLMNSDRI